jgi:methylated-DNA-[protein]-cysteine S-methyltransferase
MPSIMTIDTPIGPVSISVEGGALRELRLDGALPATPGAAPDAALAREVAAQLDAYFAGERRSFDLPLGPVGTAWQRAVWDQLARIPYGTVASYGAIAARLGRPTAARAVGAANRTNPVAIVVPCHRVIGASGALTGYAGGMWRKEWLLKHEGYAPAAG